MALQGDGTGIVTIPSAVATGDFSIVFDSVKLTSPGNAEVIIGDGSANNQFIAIFATADISARVGGFNTTPRYAGSLDEVVKLELKRETNLVTLLVDDVSIGTVNVDSGTQFSLSTFFAYNSGSLKGEMLLAGTVTMIGFGSTRTYNMEGTGTDLIDTTSAENGTLSGFTTGGYTAPAPSDTITITSVSNDSPLKRDGNSQATFTIAGTISGTATTVEYRLDSGSWLTLDSSPSTTFTGSVVVTNEQDVSVRFSNNTAVTDTVLRLKAAVIIAIGPAQSNGVSRLFSTQALSVASGKPTPTMYRNGTTSIMQDPTNFDNSVTNGSIWIHVAKYYSDAGIPVCFVNVAVAGTKLDVWQPASTNHDRIVAAGNDLGGISILMTLIGESDSSAGTSKATFKSEYLAAVSNINTTFSCPVYAVYFPVGANTGTTQNVNTIRDAYDELITENAYINDGGDLAVIDISVAADPSVNDDLHIRNDTDALEAGDIIYTALTTTYSSLDITATGYPDGTYSAEFYQATTPLVHIITESITFSGGVSSATIPLAASTTVYTRIDGSSPPSTGVTCYGVTT